MQNDLRNAINDHSYPTSPRMSLKCAYYLTDCSTAGCGNTWIIPGSVVRARQKAGATDPVHSDRLKLILIASMGAADL